MKVPGLLERTVQGRNITCFPELTLQGDVRRISETPWTRLFCSAAVAPQNNNRWSLGCRSGVGTPQTRDFLNLTRSGFRQPIVERMPHAHLDLRDSVTEVLILTSVGMTPDYGVGVHLSSTRAHLPFLRIASPRLQLPTRVELLHEQQLMIPITMGRIMQCCFGKPMELVVLDGRSCLCNSIENY